ncbi:TIM-barrel domain-containing protein [Aquimarina gracilis]|uniref:TIM-barrel domain-containing protein n=1 Tax=Aquimarina gracilis TaxID=874422 RepID=A0ABU5ZSQ8_9FLAO|nr:TIM-barrel domain-containing protein [Aquimarina gracilis]MEB3345087.1 TIM-barrel domain-containing protein [Aquimarina gracilis]
MTPFFNQTMDLSLDCEFEYNEFYLPTQVTDFNKKEKSGYLKWLKYGFELEYAFNKTGLKLVKKDGKEMFQEDYETDPILKWAISFVSQKTLRLQLNTSKVMEAREPSLMLDGKLNDSNWNFIEGASNHQFKSDFAEVNINTSKWCLCVNDKNGKEVLKTIGLQDNKGLHQKYLPFSFIRNPKNHKKTFVFSTALSYDERIYGCGESFAGLNKRGQIINLFTSDVQSASTREMYKPIPLFISNKGYGVFVHSSAPMTFDFGHTYDSASTLYIEDELLDVFIFIGTPKEILEEYTTITGKSPLPPIWSFGLWMSQLSYSSQKEVENIAQNLRSYKIPSDVIHIDAGWFENGYNCDYNFSSAFKSPKAMISNLKNLSFRTSLWQIPYYNSTNSVYNQIVEQQLFVKEANGLREDIVLDFSNPQAIAWYTKKINSLLKLGVSAIKADFGESAPINGCYYSKQSGNYEHNLYPLRYTSSLYKTLKNHDSDTLIWARSAWAGSQRFPVHWSGDPEVSNEAMASTLRAGLSLGLSGFTYWSHDIGGFSDKPDLELFLRWTFMGVFSSHSRVHGLPPREPWAFGEQFLINFRKLIEIKYCLLPYIISQSNYCSQKGYPLLRPLFFDFGEDLNTWHIEDQYLFGDSILIAPFFESNVMARTIYLPHGNWFDYFTGDYYKGGQWYHIKSKNFGIALIKSGSCIPHIELAQSTSSIDWTKINLNIYSKKETQISTQIYLPNIKTSHILQLDKLKNNEWVINKNETSIHFKIQTIT